MYYNGFEISFKSFFFLHICKKLKYFFLSYWRGTKQSKFSNLKMQDMAYSF